MPFPSSPLLLRRYRFESLIGEGAFARVYLVTHLELTAPRALKVLRRDERGVGSEDFAEYITRFQLEARLGAQLDHPHVIRIYDFEREEKTIALAMEYAAGGSLAERIAKARENKQPFAIDEAVRIALEVAEGLAAIHALDVVHRDLKPSNILFDAKGNVKVADLGLAQIPGGDSLRSLPSQAKDHPGTPQYMSPEQSNSKDYLRAPSDIFALGCVLFEMLTLRVYNNQRPGARAQSLRPDVPHWLDDALAKMLKENSLERFFDGAETANSLRLEVGNQKPPLLLTLAGNVTLELLHIPAGEFLMGSDKAKDKDALDRELPQHKIYLPDYHLGKTPITVAQFTAFVNASKYKTTAEKEGSVWGWDGSAWKEIKGANWQKPRGENSNVTQKMNHPVTCVSWDDAIAFCEWASKATKQQVRLPSEAEWEKGARGTDGRIYPWGDDAPDDTRCNFNMNVKDTTSVGQYSPRGDSPYGCEDMAGNVWEWCNDWYDENYYKNSPSQNPMGPTTGSSRVLRGGSFPNNQRFVRSAFRDLYHPRFRNFNLGFRVLVSSGSRP